MPGFLLDTSVWIAWFFQKHPHHLLAINLLKARSNSDPAWLCRATEQSFLRLATTAAVCRAYSTVRFPEISYRIPRPGEASAGGV